jgi:hypothetical protein
VEYKKASNRRGSLACKHKTQLKVIDGTRILFKKLFGINFLARLVNQTILVQWEILCTLLKWSSLQNRVCKFTLKEFIRNIFKTHFKLFV